MGFFRKSRYGRSFTRQDTLEAAGNKQAQQAKTSSQQALADRAHNLDVSTILSKLRTNEQDGLSEESASKRLEE